METKLFRTKKVYSPICRLSENTWQECQYVVQTLDDEEFEKIIVKEIRELLDG